MKFIFTLIVSLFFLGFPFSGRAEENRSPVCPHGGHYAFARESSKDKDKWSYAKDYWYSCKWGSFHCKKISELEERIAEIEAQLDRENRGRD